MRFPGILPALVMALPAAAADSIEIRHAAVECVPRERYARIAASGVPAERVAAADLEFRVAGDGPWYSVGMTAEGGEWSALLPRPMRPLDRFEYRVVMRSADLEAVATAPFAVRVGNGPDECAGTQASVVVEALIVVRVPAGAPVVPPVPPGFSPAGVVAAVEPLKKSSSTKKWVGLAGVAGGVAAAAVAAGSASRPPPIVTPDFAFDGSSPLPGSVLSLSRDRLSVFVRISGGERNRLDLLWRLDLLGGTGESACAVMADVVTVGPGRPQTVLLTSRLMPSGACGPSFDVQTARLIISLDGGAAYDQTHVLPYHFEP